MLRSLKKIFTAKCDMIPEKDPTKKSSEGDFPDEGEPYYALDMYPERRGEIQYPSMWRRLLVGAGKEMRLRQSCQASIYKATVENPVIKLLLNALDSAGCTVDIPRLLQCELCDYKVCGGYDAAYNQVVVCYNTARFQSVIEDVLIHELIHVFDHCRNNISFRNHEHVACTEIRAANLLNSTYLSCYWSGYASMFNIKGQHRECVRARAIETMVTSRNLSTAEATKIVNKVFDRCYADLEPFGRRLTSRYDADMVHREGKYFGY